MTIEFSKSLEIVLNLTLFSKLISCIFSISPRKNSVVFFVLKCLLSQKWATGVILKRKESTQLLETPISLIFLMIIRRRKTLINKIENLFIQLVKQKKNVLMMKKFRKIKLVEFWITFLISKCFGLLKSLENHPLTFRAKTLCRNCL